MQTENVSKDSIIQQLEAKTAHIEATIENWKNIRFIMMLNIMSVIVSFFMRLDSTGFTIMLIFMVLSIYVGGVLCTFQIKQYNAKLRRLQEKQKELVDIDAD